VMDAWTVPRSGASNALNDPRTVISIGIRSR